MSVAERDVVRPQPAKAARAHVITIGNEKGGSGKSTTAMHLIVALLRDGNRVGSLDLDGRQASLSRYLDNRRNWMTVQGQDLPMPEHRQILSNEHPDRVTAERADGQAVADAVTELSAGRDFLVIDCPGSDTPLSRFGHGWADTLVTPLNDSFVDLDGLARVSGDTYDVNRPGHYAALVWEAKKARALRDGGTIEWIVMRNRLSNLDAHNKRNVAGVLERLSRRIGFRHIAGFGERVIFRELFLQGLTLLDLPETGQGLRMSHVAARQEVRTLVEAIGLSGSHGRPVRV